MLLLLLVVDGDDDDDDRNTMEWNGQTGLTIWSSVSIKN